MFYNAEAFAMPIPWDYSLIEARHRHIRTWAGDITSGNRCALVMGVALTLKPDKDDVTFKGLDIAKANVRDMPFLEKMFLKAEDVANKITKRFGAPDHSVVGDAAAVRLKDFKGVVLLRDCFRTPSEKVKSWVHLPSSRSGDHIDLWNGTNMEIYPTPEETSGLLRQSAKVLLWTLK